MAQNASGRSAPSKRSWRHRAGAVLQSVSNSGVDVRRIAASVRGLRPFLGDRRLFLRQLGGDSALHGPVHLLPMLADRGEQAGEIGGQYFWQDLHMARLVHDAGPVRHVDVGSRIDGFIAHLLVFREVEVVDVRPLDSPVPGLRFIQGNAVTLDVFPDGSIDSLSSLHAVEHFGLGRYGDPVDAGAPQRALRSFARVLRSGGRLYLAVPIGQRRVEFNAHRVFDPRDPIDALADLELIRFDAIDDHGTFHEAASPAHYTTSHYALGMYVFGKR